MYIRFKEGKELAVTLSYDDGVKFDSRLVEIMNNNGLKGTFNISSGCFREEKDIYSNKMTLQEAKELYINSGHEIAIHGLTHPFLERLDKSEIVYEIIEDRRTIEKEFKTIARGMAYPFGTYDERVVNIIENCGISYARTTKSTESFDLPTNWLTLNPTCHHNNPRLMELANMFINKYSWNKVKLFYLWGHSYEFNNDNNWNIIEEFAEYIGKRDDIWYATNIEIYDYVKAYNSLETSYDKSIIYNPSSMDIWVYINGDTKQIKSGETLQII